MRNNSYKVLLILITNNKGNMKKIIMGLTVLLFSTVSANAVSLPSFTENLSLTAGLAANQGVFGGTAKETNRDDSDVIKRVNKESGVFTDSYTSQFIELGLGQWISLGYEHTPDSISTPQNVNSGRGVDTAKVSVDFNELNTTYVKLNMPFMSGLYVKAGSVETDLDIKETMASGSTYKNVSTSGSMMGVGYQTYFKETGFGLRFEGSYMEFDNVSTSNGVAADGATAANSGQNLVDASNLEGLAGKLAVTYTFGRN